MSIFTLKDHFKEGRLYLNRTVTATVIVCLLLSLLAARLIFLQIYQHDLYKTLSLNNQVRIVPITPTRGLIFDRNGVLLADNIPAFSLEITPERVQDLPDTLNAIHAIIPITESERLHFLKRLKYKRRSEGIPIKFKLTEEEVAKFSLEKHRLPGVDIVARLVRHYPKGEFFAHALGYIGPISEKDLEEINPADYRGAYYIGKIGLEKSYEKVLYGTAGYQHIETDAKGRTIRILNRIPPMQGSNLYLSLDSAIQEKATEALGGYKGVVIALDPNTGEILSLVSNPSFDPNLFVQGIDTVTYRALQDSKDKPLFNRAIRGQYPPGSTVKPLVALKGLSLGTITPQFCLFDPGFYQLPGKERLYRDWTFNTTRRGHGWVDVEKAIEESSDTYFFDLAHKLGVARLHDIYSAFKMGQLTGIDLPGEAPGLVPSAEWKQKTRKEPWYAGDTLNIGIGQGMLSATPIQVVQFTALLATRGVYAKPHLVKALQKPDAMLETQEVLKETLNLIQNPAHWDLVHQSMQKVIHSPSGTAYRISQGIKYTMAGKTGTAQVFNIKQNEKYEAHKIQDHLRDHSWFIAFAPAEDPKIAVAVLVENAGQKKAKDVAREVLDVFFNSAGAVKK